MQGVELSGWQIAFFLVMGAVFVLGPLIAGAFMGRWIYKERTPPAKQTRSGAVRSSILGAIVTPVVLLLYGLFRGFIDILTGS